MVGTPHLPMRLIAWLSEYLRINAIRRMFSMVHVRTLEVAVLVALAVLFAVFEGIGLSLLLPILQYADGDQTAIVQGSGPVWSAIAAFMDALDLPITLGVLLVLAFVPILLRQGVFYVNAWYSAAVSTRIVLRLRMQTIDTVLAADPEFFSRHSVGHLAGVIVAQTAVGGSAVLAVLRQLSLTLLMLVYVAILLALSVPLTLSVLFFAVLVWLGVRANIRHIRDYGTVTAHLTQGRVGHHRRAPRHDPPRQGARPAAA